MISRREVLAAPLVSMAAGAQIPATPPANGKYTFVDLAAPATPVVWAGIPFRVAAPARVVGAATIPINARCHYLVVAHACERHPEDTDGPFGQGNPRSRFEPVGLPVATYAINYDGFARHEQPIRRRYEINPPGRDASHVPAAARPAFEEFYRPLDDSVDSVMDWPELQTSVGREVPAGFGPVLWIYALANPKPESTVRSLGIQAVDGERLTLAGVTLFHRVAHPLRRLPLRRVSISLPRATADWKKDWKIAVDLGVVGRVYPSPEFDAPTWLDDPYKGLGAPRETPRETRRLVAEIDAAESAALTLSGAAGEFHYDLAPRGAVEVLEAGSAWRHVTVVDAATGKPTPARVAFLSGSGRYIAPYGHAEDINVAWMQNTTADVKIGGASYAMIDGSCQVNLPPGDVYVEVSKGFEYAPVRRKLAIAPGQRDLRIPIERTFDTRRDGWHTADTHVHIGSPQLLVLEGAAEGVDLVNLLAAEWGRHYTNLVDKAGRYEGSTAETTVWVGSENRHHFLGHIGLLGLKSWVLPLSEGGPPVAYFGQPTRHTLAEFADMCRAQGGLTVGMHFPIPNGETAADVVLGKLDAAEIRFDHGFATLGVTEYYRYLNAGYRMAAAGGTDKMFPTRAVGAVRTYARLDPGEPFSFAAWSRAVKAGRTFVTCGPLLFLHADGVEPGGEIDVRGGRDVEVRAETRSVYPAGEIEIVWNGAVVAHGPSPLREKIALRGAGWLAARCASRDRLPYGMRNIGAHTSPVYVNDGARRPFSRDSAEYLLRLVDGSLLWVDTLGTYASTEDRARMRGLFAGARRALEDAIRRHSGNRV